MAQILFSRLWHAGTLLTLYGIASELDFFYRSELESGESFFFFFFKSFTTREQKISLKNHTREFCFTSSCIVSKLLVYA